MTLDDNSGGAPTSAYVDRLPRKTHPVALLVFIVIVTAAIAGGSYFAYVRAPLPTNTRENLAATGFGAPTAHRLDSHFTDADGDLIADAPTDAAHLIDPPTLTFAFIEMDDPARQKVVWKSFIEHLSKVTGKPVEYVLVAGTKDLLQAMHDGKLDVAGFNTGTVPSAVNMCGFVPICAIPTAEGSAFTRTEIIVPADSALQKASDLKGHELTLTEPASNSGYKAPLVLLRSDFNLQPLSDVLLRYSGSHEASIDGIAQKKYEAAAVAEDMLSRQLTAGAIKPEQYRVIYSSETFPTAGLGYVYNLKPELAAKVKDALLTFDWKGTELEDKFSGAKQTKFVRVNYKNDWSLIRRIDDEMGVDQKIE